MTDVDLADAFGIEPPDEPPVGYCIACTLDKAAARPRVEHLESAIRKAVADLNAGVDPTAVALDLAAAEGPF